MALTWSVLFLTWLCVATAKVDFCAENIRVQSHGNSKLEFTKELAQWEYAVESEFKSLHCCSKGYLSIEWFKDGRPYPWPGDVSSFILYPESANQTIYTQTLRSSDAGNYTCRVHNDTLDITHNSELSIFDNADYMEKPLATYKPSLTTSAQLGSDTRLFCEAFVGHIALPDANTEVKWEKQGNETFANPRVQVQNVNRENGQIAGAYLTISQIEESDFGTYVCTISNTGDQKIVMETQLQMWTDEPDQMFTFETIFCLAMISLVVLISLMCCLFQMWRCKKSQVPQVWVKVVEVMKAQDKQMKQKGLVLLFDEKDVEFVDNVVSPLLRQQSFMIFPHKLTHQGLPSEEMKNMAKKIGRIVVVLSPQLTAQWAMKDIVDRLEAVNPNGEQTYVLCKEALPISTTPQDHLKYKQLIKKANVFTKSNPIENEVLMVNRLISALAGSASPKIDDETKLIRILSSKIDIIRLPKQSKVDSTAVSV